jgi:hypothetical protein
MLVCTMATTLPSTRVTTEMSRNRYADQSALPAEAFDEDTHECGKAGSFAATAMKAVTEVGAP